MKARARKFTDEVARPRNLKFVRDYKETHPCVKCGETDWVVLQFHHIGGKDINIANAVNIGWGLERIKKEISKCVIMCANCHIRLHYEERVDAG